MKLLWPVLLMAYTFVGVLLGTQHVVGWREVVALGPMGIVVFAAGYCVDLLIFSFLARRALRATQAARARARPARP